MEVISDFRGDYRFLSNFQASTVEYDGVLYPTVENAYQAAKTLDLTAREPFTRISAKDAKKLGRELAMRPDWEEVKVDIMTGLVYQKFKNHPQLKQRLLDTGDALLVEGNWWGDTFWGMCKGEGKNMLGMLLMIVRKHAKSY